MYLRPASWAPRTARSRLSVWRRLASLISIGRLTPAMTSILPRSMTEIAKFEGVPPNMSVSSTAPSPLSTSAIERRISWRRCSMSSSGPMQTKAIWACAPTTCSRAAANSAARRPWVTRTIQIIGVPLVEPGRRRSARDAGQDRRKNTGRRQIAMGYLGTPPGCAQPCSQPLGDVDRAVAPAGAADADCQIGLAFRLVARQQRVQQPPQPGKEELAIGVLFDMRGNRRIAPGQLPQRGNIVRIIEKAHVEDQIGIARDAAAIGKRGHKDTQSGLLESKVPGQQALQIGGGQEGGVDHQISTVAEGRERLALEPDSIHVRTVAGEGVGASGFRITPFEALVITIHKQHSELPRAPANQAVEGFEHALDREAAGSGVGTDRNRRRIRRSALDQRGDQRERQIVEGLIAHVLEYLEGGRPPGSRHSCHDEHAGAPHPDCGARHFPTTAGHHRPIIAGSGPIANARRAWRYLAAAVMCPTAREWKSGRRRWRHWRSCGSRPRSDRD